MGRDHCARRHSAGDSKIELILEMRGEKRTEKAEQSVIGRSYNIYNQAQKKMEQYGSDVGGNIFFMAGSRRREGYYTDENSANGGPFSSAIFNSFLSRPDKVRPMQPGATMAARRGASNTTSLTPPKIAP